MAPKPRKERIRGQTPQYDKDRKVWTRTIGHEAILYHRLPSDDEIEEVRLGIRANSQNRPTYVSLTTLTVEEIDALKVVIDEAFALARPICVRFDEEAHQRWEAESDDSNSRLYRAVPVIYRRKRDESQHGEGVPERPEQAPSGDGSTGNAGGPESESGGEPDEVADDGGSEDDR